MRKIINNIICSLGALLLFQFSYAQQDYQYNAEIKNITKTGFYKIHLTPEVSAKCKEAGDVITDLRIFDENKLQVPYLVRYDNIFLKNNNFLSFPMLENKIDKNGNTNVVIENTDTGLLKEFILVIKNTEVCRNITLSGSDNKKNWFVIKENIWINLTFQSLPTGDFLKGVDFVPSRYKYFRLTVKNDKVLPIDIIKVGIYKDSFYTASYDTLPQPQIKQKDSSNKSSYVNVFFNERYHIDQLAVDAGGAKYFNRQLEMRINPDNNSYEVGGNFTLNSAGTNSFGVYRKVKNVTLVINNDDNPPLQITAVKAYALQGFLITYLDERHQYKIQFGNDSVSTPKYDFSFFIDSVGSFINTAAIGDIKTNKIIFEEKKLTEKNRRGILWMIIITTLFILLLFTRKMVKEVDKRKEHDNL